jgi:hypothetical protein
MVGLRLLAAAVALLGAASRVTASDASFLAPGRGESLAPGSLVRVEWRYACDSALLPVLDEAEVVLSLDGGMTYPIRVSRELDPCEATVLWRVPALASDSARLALRVGEGMEDSSEAIAVVSPPFRILPDADGRGQAMLQRTKEWWIDPETEVLDSDDLLGQKMRSSRGALTAAVETADSWLPTAGQGLRRERCASGTPVRNLPGGRRHFAIPPAPAGAATPLRL